MTDPIPQGLFCCEVTDDAGKPFGWLAVDSAVGGRSYGGVRLTPNVSPAELRRLAYRMTLKFGFLGLSGGGAKAGIVGNPEAPPQERQAALRRFMVALSPFIRSGCYQPAADVGTSEAEIAEAMAHIGVGRSRQEPSREQSGFYTSLTVVAGARAAARHLGQELAGLRAAVHGFGKVGVSVAQGLAEHGATIVAVSTSQGALYQPHGLPVETLAALARRAGSGFVLEYKEAERQDKEELLTLPVDVLCPCALSDSLHAGNAAQVQARIVSPGANCAVTLEAERCLVERGTLCLPDFVTNSGGVLGGTMAFAGLGTRTIRRLVEEQVEPRIAAQIARGQEGEELPSQAAEREALARFEKVQRQAEQRSLKRSLFQHGLALYRHGLIPRLAVGALAPSYFRAILR